MFRFLGVLGSGDLGIAPSDGFADPGSGEHVAVQEDGNLPAHVPGGQVGEFLRPFFIELERDHRLAALVCTGFGIFQIFPGEDGVPFHVLELQHGRLAQHGNGLFRILHSGQFHDDLVLALALDHRFRQAQFIDPAFDDLDGPVDGVVIHLAFRRFLGLEHHMGAALQVQALFYRTGQRLDEYGKCNHDGQH